MSDNNELLFRYKPLDFTDPNTQHDRVLVVVGENRTKFYVYAGHLAFCSEFFRTLFNGNFKEKDEKEIELKELDAEDFHSFLKALIPGNKSAVTDKNYVSVLACARRFLAADVISQCEKFVIDDYDSLDKMDLFKMAFEYNWETLKARLTEDIIQRTAGCQHSGCKGFIVNYCCNKCKRQGSHWPVHLDKNSFLVQNQEKLSTLPAEVQAYILNVILKVAKNY